MARRAIGATYGGIGNRFTSPGGGVSNYMGGIPSISAEQISENGMFKWDNIKYVPEHFFKKAKKGIIKEGDILIIKDGATTGKCAFVDSDFPFKKAMINEHTYLLRTKHGLLSKYVCYFLKSHYCKEYFEYRRKLGVIGGLNKNFICDIKLPVPPLDEQRRIVARIEELTRRAEEARRLRQEAIKQVTDCLSSVVYSFFRQIPDTCFDRLDNVAEIIGGTSLPKDAPRPRNDSETVFLMKVSDMNTIENEKYIVRCALMTRVGYVNEIRQRTAPTGSIVIPKRGGAIATNKKRVLSRPAVLDPNLMAIYPKRSSSILSEFMLWWFESFDLASIQDDGGLPQINKKHLAPLPFPVIDMQEQQNIVRYFNGLRGKRDELLNLQTEVDTKLGTFAHALLAKAFPGEL